MWVDKEGRRSKVGFMERARKAFRIADPAQTTEGTFERDFELMFELLSTLSAPDTDASGSAYDVEACGYASVLDERYELAGASGASLDDKVAALWTCYHEAPSRRILFGQDQKPRSFATGLDGLRRLWGFVVAVVPVVTLLGFLLNMPVPRTSVRDVTFVIGPGTPVQSVRRATVRDLGAVAWRTLGRLGLRTVGLAIPSAPEPQSDWWARLRPHAAATVVLGLICRLLLYLIGIWRSLAPNRPATTIPWLAMIPWLYLQVLFAVPVLLYSLLGLILSFAYVGVVGQWLRLLSDEREGARNRPAARVPTLSLAAALAWLARRPIVWLRSSVATDSRFTNLADLIEAQLAFYDMQQRGVQTGLALGDALDELWRDLPEMEKARLHLAGHSFGALVVANAARTLAFRPEFKGEIRTVTFLQGALASAWYDRERVLLDRVTGAVSSVFSRYDTANGFWYPLGNLGREAAGHVGLCGGLDIADNPMPPMLVVPPQLGRPGKPPKGLNVDASRLVYDGPPAVGGGHGDIYKDDVIHVLWAAMQL
jgi:hypothetical protein